MSEYKELDTKTISILNSVLAVVADLQTKCGKLEREVSRISQFEEKLDAMITRIEHVEQKCEIVLNRNKMIEEKGEQVSTVVHKIIDRCKENVSKISLLEEAKDNKENTFDIKCVNDRLSNMESDVEELQWRSMTNNIIISGLKHEPNEDTENIVRDFIRKKLGIVENMNFVSVHRFGKQRQNIMTKFVSLKDKQLVMRNCHKLKGTNISVRAQFPVKIEKKRKSLYPVLKQAKKDRKKAVLIRDKLFIEGELYKTNDDRVSKNMDRKEIPNRNSQIFEADKLSDKCQLINSTRPSDFNSWNRPIPNLREMLKRNRINSDEPDT
ncbi:unnamed protein product [Mytilus edulis]|uniref:Endonuclease-reverse transcriptase n=1 Tax=Mytilus edulis TaxID=6550 RepID=A0A8S3RN15_MYTED|nr:unnamed protein product [Mytilus edulis]